MVRTKCTMAVFYGLLTARKAEKIRNHILISFGSHAGEHPLHLVAIQRQHRQSAVLYHGILHQM